MRLHVTNGTKIRISENEGTLKTKITSVILKKEYSDKKLTSYEIASKYGYSAVWINILRKRFKIPLVSPHQRNKTQRLSSLQKQYIYGGLLGDDCLKKPVRSKNAYLVISQNKIQKEYVVFKRNIMSDFVNTEIKYYKDLRKGRKGQFYFRTISHPVFTKIYKLIYGSGKKTVSSYWLEQLTPFSLAIWFMDDGSIARTTRQMRISTESFGKKELLLLTRLLRKKWNISPKIISSPIKGKFVLLFTASERDKFFSLIKSFVIPKMSYKLCQESSWNKWSPSEIKFLTQNYTGWKKNWEKLTILNHSKEAIARKASYLNLAFNQS